MITTISCDECRGTGLAGPTMASACGKCQGNGQVTIVHEKKSEVQYPDNDSGRLVKELMDNENLSDRQIEIAKSFAAWVQRHRALTVKQYELCRQILDEAQ